MGRMLRLDEFTSQFSPCWLWLDVGNGGHVLLPKRFIDEFITVLGLLMFFDLLLMFLASSPVEQQHSPTSFVGLAVCSGKHLLFSFDHLLPKVL